MRGLAKILRQLGHQVSGCDLKLRGHSQKHIDPSLDRVVFTSAASTADSPAFGELAYAKKIGVTILKRSAATAEIFKDFKTIAVSGMHGKTTLSLMIVKILENSGEPVSYNIGAPEGRVGNEFVAAANFAKGKFFVVEACEFDRAFLDFSPYVGVITNIEAEHLDYYKGGIEEILDAFYEFAFNIQKGGLLVVYSDNPWCRRLLEKIKNQNPPFKILTFGEEAGADLKVSQIKIEKLTSFKLNFKETSYLINLRVAGRHNALNAAAAFGASHFLGASSTKIKEGLEKFSGGKRRLEYVADARGIKIFDDYGHHPTEIQATLRTLKQLYSNSRLIVVFQPHQVSRTKLLFKEFLQSFNQADILIVTDIYQVPGREEKLDLNSEDLVWGLKKEGINAHYLPLNTSLIVKYLERVAATGDIILTLGATDIYEVGLEFIKNKQHN